MVSPPTLFLKSTLDLGSLTLRYLQMLPNRQVISGLWCIGGASAAPQRLMILAHGMSLFSLFSTTFTKSLGMLMLARYNAGATKRNRTVWQCNKV